MHKHIQVAEQKTRLSHFVWHYNGLREWSWVPSALGTPLHLFSAARFPWKRLYREVAPLSPLLWLGALCPAPGSEHRLPQQPLQPAAERARRGPSPPNSPAPGAVQPSLGTAGNGLWRFTPLPSLPQPPLQPGSQTSFSLLWLSVSDGNPELGRRMMDVCTGSLGELTRWESTAHLPFFLTGIKDSLGKFYLILKGKWLAVSQG